MFGASPRPIRPVTPCRLPGRRRIRLLRCETVASSPKVFAASRRNIGSNARRAFSLWAHHPDRPTRWLRRLRFPLAVLAGSIRGERRSIIQAWLAPARELPGAETELGLGDCAESGGH